MTQSLDPAAKARQIDDAEIQRLKEAQEAASHAAWKATQEALAAQIRSRAANEAEREAREAYDSALTPKRSEAYQAYLRAFKALQAASDECSRARDAWIAISGEERE